MRQTKGKAADRYD
ncbi:hypothetical protein D018_0910A, partial [Vibrio parahaemolyticus VP2007-007]